MRLITLGTSCAQQTLTRTQSANALLISPSITYLFDCGSSTSTTLLQSGIKANSIRKIFITHLHTDHVIGLTGLMTDLLGGHGGKIEDFNSGVIREGGGSKVLDVYGPCGTKEFLRTTFRLTYTMLANSFRVHELLFESDPKNSDDPFKREEGSRDVRLGADNAWKDISCDNRCTVTAVPIQHSVPCLGYIVTENDNLSLPQETLATLQTYHKPGSAQYPELVKMLKSGGTVELPDSVLGPLPREKGRQVVILGDTSDPSAILPHIRRPVSLVLHESTNAYLPTYGNSNDTLEGVRERAISRGHSTPEMAGEFARRCQSQILVLTHFSSRYSGADIKGAIKVMRCFEKLASLAGSATQESVEALFLCSDAQHSKKQRKESRGVNDLVYAGDVIAAWDGMSIEIPPTGVMLTGAAKRTDPLVRI